jgi:hypothetical protein
MSRTNEMTRNLWGQEPGLVDCHALAASFEILSQREPARYNSDASVAQIHKLRRLHGLTDTQARLIAGLAWGAVQ